MAHDRKFRFGVQVTGSASASQWAAKARKAEGLGFAALTLPDHLDEQLAPIPALVAAADSTSTIRLGTLVLGNDYRHPVVAAKEAATLDVLSGGRLELGLGAGWMRSDYEQAGMRMDSPGTRIERLGEALQVVKGCMSQGPFDFEGSHYRVRGYDGQPKPVQRPHPPVLVGGGGRRVLSLAAREADIVGVNPNLRAGAAGPDAAADAVASSMQRKVAWVREAAGRRFDELELSVRVFFVIVTNDREQVARSMAPGFGLSVEDALEVPIALVGSPGQIIDQLHERRERYGFSYVVVGEEAMDAIAPVVAKLAGT